MNTNRELINELYSLYGFTKELEDISYSVYIYEQGYFTNVEIVLFDQLPDDQINTIKDEYIRTGYSVSLRENCEYNNLKNTLFTGFFRVKESKQRVNSEYLEFCKIQKRKLGGIDYSYIPSQYTINGKEKSEDILDGICEIMNEVEPQLIILEAPAGFGKTCTSYEISNRFALTNDIRVPILAELSKNRSAKIFDYVLLTEIDRKFSKLSSGLVTHQITEGNLPLIIDGFDELLSKSSLEDQDKTEDVKTMLDTIAALFKEGCKTKVLLTSRKSSMFTGELFENWVVDKLSNCTVTRFQIIQPTVTEWITTEKMNLLRAESIQIDSISNPVLLALLRSVPLEEFKDRFNSTSDILETYMSLLLKREKERQLLLIDEKEQRMIMRRLAAWFVDLDISCDEPEGIKAIIEDIIKDKVDDYLKLYEIQNTVDSGVMIVSSQEEFVMKLVHSALLDRVSLKTSYIGFVNEFIFGLLIGEAIIAGDLCVLKVPEKYLGMAVTSFAAKDLCNKRELSNQIRNNRQIISTEIKIAINTNLDNRLEYDYMDEYVSNVVFTNGIDLKTEHYFYNCCFQLCTFKNIDIYSDLFVGCYFVNCNFYEIKVESKPVEEKSDFISCTGNDYLERIINENVPKTEQSTREERDIRYYEKLVLEQYWMTGSNHAEMRKSEITLFKGIPSNQRRNVLEAIESLIDKGILRKLKYCYELNNMKMSIIQEILGR